MNQRQVIFPANGSSVELRNCLTEAEDRVRCLNADFQKALAPLLAAGRFVVVAASVYHCKSTDAVAGLVKSIHGHFETRDDAVASIYALPDSYHDDVSFSVLPEIPRPAYCPPVGKADETDDVPF